MKINRKALCREFQHAPAEETVSTEGVNSYLLEEVLRPALCGNPPKLKDIDYDAFDEEDIGELCFYYEKMWHASKKLRQFLTAVTSIAPVPSRDRHFC